MFCNHQNTLNTGDCNLGPTIFSSAFITCNAIQRG